MLIGKVDCLKCDGSLVLTDVGGVGVDRCDACSGIWFDSGELTRVLKQRDVEALANERDNNDGHDAARIACPRCGGDGMLLPIVSRKRSDLHIDTCAVCGGQWLDGGELEKLHGDAFWTRLVDLFR